MPSQSTIRDVARKADVSLGTVSNYLTDRKPVASATRERIAAAIEELAFVPNTAVRVMRGGRSHVVAFIVPDGVNPFFAQIVRGIEDVAMARGHVVVVCNTEGDEAREGHYAKALSEMRARAAIAIASTTSDSLLQTLSDSGATVVTLGRAEDSDFQTVSVDELRGGFLAMSHVLAKGHRRVVFLGGPGAEPQIRERFAGCVAAFASAGIDAAGLERVDAESSSQTARTAAARQVLAMMPRPSAVVCANDVIALALEFEALRQGIRVPEDIAIVGYDDIEGAANAPIPLTTIHQPGYDLGRCAAELAFAADPSATSRSLFVPHLVERLST